MEDQDIINSLEGTIVTISSKSNIEAKMRERKGLITSIEPCCYLKMKVDEERNGHIVFAGQSEGIYQIVNEAGKTLYENNAVLNAYEISCPKTEVEMIALRAKGEFYLE